jgi:hypothetical protein
MRTLTVDHAQHIWVFNLAKHRWIDTAHNKIKPNDIIRVFQKNWKSVCDYCGESILYCTGVKLEDNASTIHYTPLVHQLERMDKDEQTRILADKNIMS